MCAPTTCRSCRKTTWSGCGQHVDQVMRGVPKAQQCTCGQDADETATTRSPSVFSRLRGKR